MDYILDTNVIISLLRLDSKTKNSLFDQDADNFHVSSISLAELYYGAYKSNKTVYNLEKIRGFFEFNEIKLQALNKKVLLQYGKLRAELEIKGQKIPEADTYIVATAKYLNIPIITKDIKHFTKLRKFGIKVKTI